MNFGTPRWRSSLKRFGPFFHCLQRYTLGIWLEQSEGAKFWLKVMTELINRGVRDIFIACVDGLKGFPEAIEAAFPKTEVQICLVHMIRRSLQFVSWKDRKAVAADLKGVYQAASEELDP